MSKNTSETSVIPIDRAAAWSPDALAEVLRTGAQRLLAQAVEAEIEAHLAAHKELLDERGRQRVVRHGHLPEREVQTGIGPICESSPVRHKAHVGCSQSIQNESLSQIDRERTVTGPYQPRLI